MHIVPYLVGYILLSLIWVLTDPTSRKLFYTPTEFLKKDQSKTTTYMTLIMLPQLVSGLFFPWPTTQFDALVSGIGNVIFWFGFILTVWAKLTMKHNWGAPAQHTIARQKTLVTWGPFRYTRNPIYVGLILMAIAASLAMRSIFTPLVILFIMHIRQMVAVEETLLLKHFGKSYKEYLKRVPRFLV
jgi:protein-S-isoprenylcysteine O-methyltransferase Ste14